MNSIGLIKKIMKEQKIAFFGLKGTYTHQATQAILKKHKLNIPMEEKVFLPDLFKFVLDDNLAIFPIENSNGGSVATVIDLFSVYDFEIIGEYYLPIKHVLLGNKNSSIETIEKVYGHPQALSQISNFLYKNQLKGESVSDNSTGAKMVQESKNEKIAAVGADILADIYNLKIIKKDVQNNQHNITRFLIIKKQRSPLKLKINLKNNHYKTGMLFETRDIPGALYKCLGGFATNGINLTKIESRPATGKKKFEAFFWIEFEGHYQDKNVQLAIEELSFFTTKTKYLGSYRRW